MAMLTGTSQGSDHLYDMVSKLEPHPDVDYFKYQHARVPHFGQHLGPTDNDLNARTYASWEADLVEQGGVAAWLWATEAQINGKQPYNGRFRTYADGAYKWKTHALVWRRKAQIPAKLETIAAHWDYEKGTDWILDMIFRGEAYSDIARALGMNTMSLMHFMMDNIDPAEWKRAREMKTEVLIQRAENATAMVLDKHSLDTPQNAALAEAQGRAVGAVTAMTRFLASARIDEFSNIKKVDAGQAAHIHISFDPKDD